MANKITITKTGATTIVTQYDDNTPSKKSIEHYNEKTNVWFDDRNEHVIIKNSMTNPKVIHFSELVGISSANFTLLPAEFATAGFFNGEKP
jgi:hypothetical protein